MIRTGIVENMHEFQKLKKKTRTKYADIPRKIICELFGKLSI